MIPQKSIAAFLSCLILLSVSGSLISIAQTSALLEIHNVGGNKTDLIDKHVVRTDDGGAIIKLNSISYTGNINTSCRTDSLYYVGLFQKYDASANLQWEKCYYPGDTGVYYIYPAGNGDFYTIGAFLDTGFTNRWFLAREDASGNRQWLKSYGGAQDLLVRSVCRSDDGGFFLACESFKTGGDVDVHYGSWAAADIWILKLDSNGNKLWGKTVGGSYDEYAGRVWPSAGGGCYIAGGTNSDDYDCTGLHGPTTGSGDLYIAKLDNAGHVIWHRNIGGTKNDGAGDICDDFKGGIYVAGAAASGNGDVHGHITAGAEAWILNIDSSGTVLWDSCYGNGGEIISIKTASDGSIWGIGSSAKKGRQTDTSYGDYDCWTVHLDSSGHFISAKVLGSSYEDKGLMICPMPDGTILFGGNYQGPAAPGGDFLSVFNGVAFSGSDIFIGHLASWTTSISGNQIPGTKITAYPNPAGDELYIRIDGQPDERYGLKITDMAGRSVYTETALRSKVTTVPVKNWARGTYLVTIQTDEKHKQTEKIMIR